MADNFKLIKPLLEFPNDDIPFNLQQFKEKYPDIDVHKNNPTLLYCL